MIYQYKCFDIQTLLLAFIHTFSFKVIIGGGKISKGYTNYDLYEI